MEHGILEDIAFNPELETLAKKLRIKPGSRYEVELQAMLADAQKIARPVAAYHEGHIESKTDCAVQINGVQFESRILRINLEESHRVFFYLATSGQELAAWSKTIQDLLQQYWADAIQEMALRMASRAISQHLRQQFQPAKTASMSPGSLEDWPITEQRNLFDLMNGLDKRIGVSLTESYLMLPVKSISGVRFPTETHFESCQLCQREDCPGRRAPYDADLYASRFA